MVENINSSLGLRVAFVVNCNGENIIRSIRQGDKMIVWSRDFSRVVTILGGGAALVVFGIRFVCYLFLVRARGKHAKETKLLV